MPPPPPQVNLVPSSTFIRTIYIEPPKNHVGVEPPAHRYQWNIYI